MLIRFQIAGHFLRLFGMLLGGNIYAEDYFFEIEIRGIRRVRN